MSAPSLAPFVLKRPWLKNLLMPLSGYYTQLAGYRQLGLLSDDLLNEENEVTALAVKRLGPKVGYDRVYRIRRAMQLEVQHKILPKSQWTKPEDDVEYLGPLIRQIEAEIKEQAALDSLSVHKKH